MATAMTIAAAGGSLGLFCPTDGTRHSCLCASSPEGAAPVPSRSLSPTCDISSFAGHRLQYLGSCHGGNNSYAALARSSSFSCLRWLGSKPPAALRDHGARASDKEQQPTYDEAIAESEKDTKNTHHGQRERKVGALMHDPSVPVQVIEEQRQLSEEEERQLSEDEAFYDLMFGSGLQKESSAEDAKLEAMLEGFMNTLKGGNGEQSKALRNVVLWVGAAAAFGVLIGVGEGWNKASEFFAGYLLEQSLSVDNLFVFVLVFNYFQVPVSYQSRVLSYGIAGAVVFRGIMIFLGVTSLQRFEALNLVFAAILLFSAFKLLGDSSEEEDDLSNNFIVKTCQKFIPVTDSYDTDRFYTMVDGVKKATPLLLTLAVIELSDVAFAVDSIPAVFGVTRDPFIVFSSNMFAIACLRSLYTVISSSMSELKYLQASIAMVLGFIGTKMIAEYFGEHVSVITSLIVVIVTLTTGVSLSLGNRPEVRETEWDKFTQNDDDEAEMEKDQSGNQPEKETDQSGRE